MDLANTWEGVRVYIRKLRRPEACVGSSAVFLATDITAELNALGRSFAGSSVSIVVERLGFQSAQTAAGSYLKL